MKTYTSIENIVDILNGYNENDLITDIFLYSKMDCINDISIESKVFNCFVLDKFSDILKLKTIKKDVFYADFTTYEKPHEIIRKTFKTVLNETDIKKINSDCKKIPEFIGFYLYHKAMQFSFTGLNTIYTKSADKMILSLMKELINIWNDNIFSKSDFEEYTIAKNQIEEYQKKVTKTKKMILINGKRHFVETIPYDVLENTITGKELINTEIEENYDVYDIIQVANIALIECFQLGLIQKYSDVSDCRNYVYRKINSYIMNEKREINKNSELNQDIQINAENTDCCNSAENVYFMENDVENEIIYNQIISKITDIMKEKARKNQNIDLAVKIWIENIINHISTHDLAKDYKIAQTQVMRYKKLVNDTIQSNIELLESIAKISA